MPKKLAEGRAGQRKSHNTSAAIEDVTTSSQRLLFGDTVRHAKCRVKLQGQEHWNRAARMTVAPVWLLGACGRGGILVHVNASSVLIATICSPLHPVHGLAMIADDTTVLACRALVAIAFYVHGKRRPS